MMKNFIICCTLLMTLITPSYGFWGNTHEEIAKSAVNERKILLNNEINKIGLDFGIEELFRDGDVNFIIRSGAITEDNGIRFRNHFYNPLDGSGLADVATGSSSYEWADQINSGWSWRNSRLSFYQGMTAISDVERRSALADSFRALGQVMHLIQDNAVPAHVRNDLHMIPDGFEAYASENVNSLNFVPIAFSGPKNSISTYSPRQLWDSDQYDGTNPKTSTTIGLAEYTNANFASEDTIFTENTLDDWSPLNNKHYFPYPRQADMVVIDESQNRIGMNGYVIYRKYFEKIGGGEVIEHFATASRLYEHLLDDPEPSIQGFDDQCYKDYANLLIPRAVGYSAALLDYFFRGQIDMTADSGQYVIKNESDEAMSGTFRLYYDDKYDMRKLVPAAEWNLSISAKGASSPVTFTAPSDAKEPGKYMLVFLGAHGAESGAVVGKVVELKSGPDARVVTVSGSYISAYVNDKKITARMPSEGLNSINSVRFDVNDWNTFVVMASYNYSNGECKAGCKEFHKFTIDGNDSTINYGGLLLRENYIYNYSSEKVYNYVWPDSFCTAGRGVGECSLADGIKIYLNNKNIKDINYVDFFLIDGNIKPFGTIEESSRSWLSYWDYQVWSNGDDGGVRSSYSPTLEDRKKSILYYGNNISEIINSNCTGGSYSYSVDDRDYLVEDVTGCSPATKIDSYFIPVAIFNKNNYAYNIYKNNTTENIISTLSIEVPKNKNGYIKSLLRNDDNYSFYADSKYYLTNKFYSYSSEVGVLPCSLDLLSKIKYNGKYVGWNKNNGLILLTSCSDIEPLNKAKVYVGDVFDVFIK